MAFQILGVQAFQTFRSPGNTLPVASGRQPPFRSGRKPTGLTDRATSAANPGGMSCGTCSTGWARSSSARTRKGNWTYLNAAWTRILGFDIASSLGTNFLEYVHPDERERTIALFMAVVAGGADHCHHESRYRTADGRYRFMELRAQVVRDDEGRVIGNTGTLTDRTEGKEAGERLTGQVQALELVARGAAVSDLPMGVARYRPDGTLARASPTLRAPVRRRDGPRGARRGPFRPPGR